VYDSNGKGVVVREIVSRKIIMVEGIGGRKVVKK
jgi:hypothetical protein